MRSPSGRPPCNRGHEAFLGLGVERRQLDVLRGWVGGERLVHRPPRMTPRELLRPIAETRHRGSWRRTRSMAATNARVAGSAQCRSSRMSSTTPLAASRSMTPMSDSITRLPSWSGATRRGAANGRCPAPPGVRPGRARAPRDRARRRPDTVRSRASESARECGRRPATRGWIWLAAGGLDGGPPDDDHLRERGRPAFAQLIEESGHARARRSGQHDTARSTRDGSLECARKPSQLALPAHEHHRPRIRVPSAILGPCQTDRCTPTTRSTSCRARSGCTSPSRSGPRAYPSELGHARRRAHGANKPPRLMARLIEFFSRGGELVLDPFAGVGGTLLGAAICRSPRRALGFEIDPRWTDGLPSGRGRALAWSVTARVPC